MEEKTSKLGVFANKWFTLYFLSATLSKVGSHMYRLAIPWFILQDTGSVALMSLMWVAGTLPYICLGPFIGVLVDRWDRRKVMLGSDLMRAVLIALLPILGMFNLLGIEVLFVVAFLLAVCSIAFDLVADFGMLPRLVKEEQLTSANSVYMAMSHLSDLLGPAIAGAAIALVGAMNVLYIDAVSYFATFLVILFMPLSFNSLGKKAESKLTVGSVMGEVKEGFAFIFRSQILWVLAVGGCLINLAMGALYTVMTYRLGSELQLSASVVGSVYSVMGMMAILGSFLAPRLLRVLPMGYAIAAANIGIFVGAIWLAMMDDWRMSLIGYGFMSIAGTISNIYTFTIRQREIPSELMGRVNSVYRMILTVSWPLSALLLGGLASTYDAKTAFLGTALLTLAAVGFTLFSRIPSYREVRVAQENSSNQKKTTST